LTEIKSAEWNKEFQDIEDYLTVIGGGQLTAASAEVINPYNFVFCNGSDKVGTFSWP